MVVSSLIWMLGMKYKSSREQHVCITAKHLILMHDIQEKQNSLHPSPLGKTQQIPACALSFVSEKHTSSPQRT